MIYRLYLINIVDNKVSPLNLGDQQRTEKKVSSQDQITAAKVKAIHGELN